MKKLVVFPLALVLLFCWAGLVQAGTITDTIAWYVDNTDPNSDFIADIIMVYPDKVTYGDYFDISFMVDSASMAPGVGGMLAFLPYVQVSDTVDLSQATWSQVYGSDDIGFHGDFNGNLGDSYAPYTSDSNGYNIGALVDPYFNQFGSDYTWLDQSYNDNVTWTLHDFIIQDHTSFTITLDANVGNGAVFGGDFLVLDPPPGNAIPEPSSLILLFSGLACYSGIKSIKGKKSLP